MSMVFTPLTETTAVEYALAAQFTSSEENLIVGRSNRLQIYCLLKEQKESMVYCDKLEEEGTETYLGGRHEV